MQSIDSIETCAYETRKDLVSEKEKVKYNNIIKWYKKWLTLMVLQTKKGYNPNQPNFWSYIQNIIN